MTVWAVLAFGLALLPFIMTLTNLRILRTPPVPADPPAVAILIPARNEERGIARCITAALASTGAAIEVVVLDDHSTDATAAIVAVLATGDPRLRVIPAPPLPPGWNGKQHACWVLSGLTDRPNLLFVDADVVLQPGAAARLAPRDGLDLVSGVPRQHMPTWPERAIIPMINVLILGYLPIALMRREGRVGLAAGCGQMMMVRASAYRAIGGHGAIRASRHDGLMLPRAFRHGGFRTDLVDGTALASCRMYDSCRAVWDGFLKNATEGMAKPLALPVWTVLLFGGHVLPWLLLARAGWTGASPLAEALIGSACALPLLARLRQAKAVGEPWSAILLHPLGVLATLAIQWSALLRHWRGQPIEWRGRAYGTDP